MEEDWERLLSEHKVPPSDALASRIAAVARPREERPTLWQALGDLLRPAPVTALACSLLVGLIASRHLPAQPMHVTIMKAPTLSQNAGAFLYYNGEIL